jgi:hypothetical protein
LSFEETKYKRPPHSKARFVFIRVASVAAMQELEVKIRQIVGWLSFDSDFGPLLGEPSSTERAQNGASRRRRPVQSQCDMQYDPA